MSTRLLHGDCRSVLKTLQSESVHCVVTSPPYFGLRDYGMAGQIGLEATPDAYVAEIVAVFREVRRVLRNDGTLWLNLGDSYSAGHGGSTTEGNYIPRVSRHREAVPRERPDLPNPPAGWSTRDVTPKRIIAGLKPKDLIGIPWMVAFALRADGWYLRQDLIWSKPNPMPESVRDRCTKAHEYLFLLSKSPRYFWDAEAIAEKASDDPVSAARRGRADFSTVGTRSLQETKYGQSGKGLNSEHKGETRNRRSVWEVATAPFSEAHFATFPPALIEPCILAGCPAKACSKCGKPWVREVEISRRDTRPNNTSKFGGLATDIRSTGEGNVAFGLARRTEASVKTLGFSPSCSCDAATVPGTCLDPFAGAGTTGLVADRLGRNAILIELNASYADMSKRRITDDLPLFAEVVAA